MKTLYILLSVFLISPFSEAAQESEKPFPEPGRTYRVTFLRQDLDTKKPTKIKVISIAPNGWIQAELSRMDLKINRETETRTSKWIWGSGETVWLNPNGLESAKEMTDEEQKSE